MTTQPDLFESPVDARRSAAEAARAADAQFFRTEPRIGSALFEHGHDLPGGVNGLPGSRWCEPGCGDGVLIAEALEVPRAKVVDGFELRTVAVEAARRRLARRPQSGKRVTVRTMNWLTDGANEDIKDDGKRLDALPPLPGGYSVVFANPPYSGSDRGRDVAAEFLRATFARCPGSWVWALLRVQWVYPRGVREDWLSERLPRYGLLLAGDRPSFARFGEPDGRSNTESTEYGWFAWPPGDRLNPRREILTRMVVTEPREGSRRDRARRAR